MILSRSALISGQVMNSSNSVSVGKKDPFSDQTPSIIQTEDHARLTVTSKIVNGQDVASLLRGRRLVLDVAVEVQIEPLGPNFDPLKRWPRVKLNHQVNQAFRWV